MNINKPGKEGNGLKLACLEFHGQTVKAVLRPLKNGRVISSAQ